MCDLYLIFFIGSWLIFVYHTSNWRYRWIQWNLFNLLDFARAGSLYACHTGQEYFWFLFWFFHLKQKLQAIKTNKVIEGSQTTYQSGKSGNCRELENRAFLTQKSENYQGFWLNVREKIGKNVFQGDIFFLEKYFPVINFLLVLFSVMYIFMFWNIFLPFRAMSILLQPGFLCLMFKCNMLDCWMIHHKWMNYLLKRLTYNGIKNSDFREVNFYTVVF